MIAIIDNYDSFTYNLVQYFKLIDHDVRVFKNDQITTNALRKLEPDLIVLSPGPGTPADSGICLEVVSHFYLDIPILGICLGHQVIATFFGGSVIKGEQPMHGKITPITHDQKGIFANILSPLKVTRYHSLIVDQHTLPAALTVTAQTAAGEIMALKHKTLPIAGLQFHPESIRTEAGLSLLSNFYDQAKQWKLSKTQVVEI